MPSFCSVMGQVSKTIRNSNAGRNFSSIGHNSAMVSVYAYGEKAEKFDGVYENTVIYCNLVKVLDK